MKTPLPKLRIQIHRSKDGFRWRFLMGRHEVARGPKPFERHQACLRTVTSIVSAISGFNYSWELSDKAEIP